MLCQGNYDRRLLVVSIGEDHRSIPVENCLDTGCRALKTSLVGDGMQS